MYERRVKQNEKGKVKLNKWNVELDACWKLFSTWKAVLRGAFLQDASGIGDEGVEVEQLVHVLPTFCWWLALLWHRDGVRVIHLDRHVVGHVTRPFPWHLRALRNIPDYETESRRATICIVGLKGK